MLCFPDSIVEWVKLIELWFGGLYVVFSRSFSVLCSKPWVWPSDSFGTHMFKSYLSWFI